MTQQFAIHFGLATLATWRVTHLLAFEDGPADVIVKLRAALGDSFVGKLMDCFKCLSLWIAAPAALFVALSPLEWLFVWLGISGAACLLQGFLPESHQPQPSSPEGDTSHVLWTETLSPEEHAHLGQDPGSR